MVKVKFPSSHSMFPFIRAGCIATNLVAPPKKMLEKVARLITKSDVISLSGPNKRLQVAAAEGMMSDAWAKVRQSLDAGTMSEERADAMFGKLATRAILFLTKKGKEGIEGKSYASLKEIKDKFIAEFASPGGAPETTNDQVSMKLQLQMRVRAPNWPAFQM